MAFGTTSRHEKSSPVSAPRPASGSTIPTVRQTKVTRLGAAWESHAASLGLTSSQQRFAKTFFAGHNTFLSGEAGTGKSYLTQALIAFLIKHSVNVGVCGTTGVASFLIGGQTLNSFCGVGLADEPVSNLISKVMKNGKAKARIKAIDVLFLDEVSMAKGDLLDKVEAVIKVVRYSREPWGGLQLCCIGDLLQLAPVFRGDEEPKFSFEAEAWKGADIQTIVLKEQMRQRGDPVLLKVLNDIRVGNTSSLPLLSARIGAIFPDDGIDPVRIFCKNVDVDRYNAERLAALPGQAKTYRSLDTGQPYHIEAFDRNCPAPKVLDLKVGAQVICLVNHDVAAGVCNGSVGVIQSFTPDGVMVKFKTTTAMIELNEWQMKEQEAGVDGKVRFKVVASRTQMPLKICYSITAHRAQGQTLDRAIVDVSEAFGEGQIYCALSRVRDMASLSLAAPIPARAVRANAKCVAFYQAIEEAEEKPFSF